MRPFRTEEMEMAWLNQEQIAVLLAECQRHENRDLVNVIKICLATGARWSEAEQLKKSQLTKFKITISTRRAKKTAPFLLARSYLTPYQMSAQVGYLMIVMARLGLLSREQVSNYRQGN